MLSHDTRMRAPCAHHLQKCAWECVRTEGLLALGQLRGPEVGARERRDAVHDHQPHVALYDRRFQALQAKKMYNVGQLSDPHVHGPQQGLCKFRKVPVCSMADWTQDSLHALGLITYLVQYQLRSSRCCQPETCLRGGNGYELQARLQHSE